MADEAHVETDKLLSEMEDELSAIYSRAESDIEAKADEYFRKFEAQDEAKRKLVDAGTLSEEAYRDWRQGKLMTGKHWTALKATLAAEYANVNKTALAYINGRLPEVYALNYNSLSPVFSSAVKGYSFELVDARTVKNLATKDETLLPYKYLDGKKDVRWNTKKVNSAVLQGILQGESISKMAKRLQGVTDMNKTSAIRNARTTVTSAECKGRQDAAMKAKEDGIESKKIWLATFDGRTRHSHALLDGQMVDVDKPFKSELGDIMYPGDPAAHPSNVYNCRCSYETKVVGFYKSREKDGMEYQERENVSEWLEKERAKDPYQFDIEMKKIRNESSDKKLLQKYKEEFGGNAPKSLAKLQEMKYNRPKEWEQYKTYTRSLRSGELSPLADFKLYKSVSAQIDTKLVGITTVNGITITGKSDHFVARVIGSVEQRRDGVKVNDVFKALTNKNTTILPVRTSPAGRHSQQFIYSGVEVSVNPRTGNLIQTNPFKRGEK